MESPREERTNAITHGLGAALAVAALVLLIIWACLYGNAWHIVSFTIFGATMVILYTASTLYHSVQEPSRKNLLRKFDHMSIFLLIAGTYTPFCLTALPGWMGWTMFGIIWGCTIFGIILKAFYTGKREVLSTILYVLMGWVALMVIKPLYDHLSPLSFTFLLCGGVLYTAGTIFFLAHRLRYHHSIWHLFVMGGSAFHFFAVLYLLNF